MANVAIDPKVLELGGALSQGYTSIAAKHALEKHARAGRINRKAAAKRAKRAKRQGWR